MSFCMAFISHPCRMNSVASQSSKFGMRWQFALSTEILAGLHQARCQSNVPKSDSPSPGRSADWTDPPASGPGRVGWSVVQPAAGKSARDPGGHRSTLAQKISPNVNVGGARFRFGSFCNHQRGEFLARELLPPLLQSEAFPLQSPDLGRGLPVERRQLLPLFRTSLFGPDTQWRHALPAGSATKPPGSFSVLTEIRKRPMQWLLP